MTAEGGPIYKVELVGNAPAQWAALYALLAGSARGKLLSAAARRIIQRLAADPRGAGEPRYQLSAAKLLVYIVVDGPLAVEYGVHDTENVVFIHDFRSLIDSDR